MSLIEQWRPHILLLHYQIKITHNIQCHLIWWNNRQIYLKVVPIKNPLPSHQLFTDASQTGWGAYLEPKGLLVHGLWTQDQSQLHNYKSSRKDGHNSCLETSTPSHNQFSSLSLYRQHNCYSLSSTTRWNSLPRFCLEVCNTLIWCYQNKTCVAVRKIFGQPSV